MSNTREDLRTYVVSKLGYPSVAVELDDTQLDLAIDESLRLFNQYMYKSEYACRQSLSANTVIDIDAESMGVVRGEFVEVDEFKDAYPDVFTLYRRLRMMPQGGDYFFRKSYRTAYRRVLDKLPSWRYDEAHMKLYIFVPASTYHFSYELAYEYKIDEIPKGYLQLFRQSAEGFARQVLADVRGKYGNTIPGATTDVNLDGAAQRELGQKLIDEVKVRLSDLREAPTPLWV